MTTLLFNLYYCELIIKRIHFLYQLRPHHKEKHPTEISTLRVEEHKLLPQGEKNCDGKKQTVFLITHFSFLSDNKCKLILNIPY